MNFTHIKKFTAIILCIGIILTALSGCSNKKSTFILSPENCVSLFSYSPQESVELLSKSSLYNFEFVSLEVNEDENLELVLTDSQIRDWKRTLKKLIRHSKKSSKKEIGAIVKTTSEFKQLTVSCKKDDFVYAVMATALFTSYFGLLQVLDGVPPDEWSVNVTVINSDNDKTVWNGEIDNAYGKAAADALHPDNW